MRFFGRRKPKSVEPPTEHQRFMVGNDHHLTRLPRVVKEKSVDPETQRLIDWRRDYDEQRKKALENKRGCGLCIEGQVRWGPVPFAAEICRCPLGDPNSLVNQMPKPGEGDQK